MTLFSILFPQHVAKGVSAKNWQDACFAAVGAGKGGGKADIANGSIPGGKDIMATIEIAAKAYAASKQ
jgi:alanyl-tRNA synthetase